MSTYRPIGTINAHWSHKENDRLLQNFVLKHQKKITVTVGIWLQYQKKEIWIGFHPSCLFFKMKDRKYGHSNHFTDRRIYELPCFHLSTRWFMFGSYLQYASPCFEMFILKQPLIYQHFIWVNIRPFCCTSSRKVSTHFILLFCKPRESFY